MAGCSVHPFAVGDFVCKKSAHDLPHDEDIGHDTLGYVTGFGPDPRWVRVRTLDNKRKIWAREKIHNVDFICGDGRYAPRPARPERAE